MAADVDGEVAEERLVEDRPEVGVSTRRGLAGRLRRARETYARRRRALIEALGDRGIEATGRSGLNVWIPVAAEAPVVQGLLDAGWSVAAGERFRLESGPAIRVTVARLDPRDAVRFADALAAVLSPQGRTLQT